MTTTTLNPLICPPNPYLSFFPNSFLHPTIFSATTPILPCLRTLSYPYHSPPSSMFYYPNLVFIFTQPHNCTFRTLSHPHPYPWSWTYTTCVCFRCSRTNIAWRGPDVCGDPFPFWRPCHLLETSSLSQSFSVFLPLPLSHSLFDTLSDFHMDSVSLPPTLWPFVF